jgi:predicted PurR-regulated permease PerM
VFELIPLFGPVLAAVPAIAIGFTGGGMGLALGVALFYIIIQQFENHLIYPLVVTKVVGVPPILVILALVIGAQLGGMIGVLLAVPMAAVVQELFADMDKRRHREMQKS